MLIKYFHHQKTTLMGSFFKYLCFTLLVGLALPFATSAQTSSEVGLLLGFSSYAGDLAPGPFALRQTRPAVGGFYRYMFNRQFAFKASGIYGQIKGDRLDVPTFVSPDKNVEMKAGILEITGNVEYFPFGGPRFNNAGLFIPRWSPYISLGLGLTFADAQITTGPEYSGGKFPESDARSTFLTLPLVGGLRLDATENLTLGLEIGARTPFSDYLDGVSQNANPDSPDWYWIGGISISYFLRGEMSEHSESRPR